MRAPPSWVERSACCRGATFAEAFTGEDPLLRHVRTRVRSPQSNGVIARFFGTLKYQHLFRGPINDGYALAVEVGRRNREDGARTKVLAGDDAPGGTRVVAAAEEQAQHDNVIDV